MERKTIEQIKEIVKQAQQANDEWVNLATLGSILSAQGINYRDLGFEKLREMFEDSELKGLFKIKKDDSHSAPPIYHVKLNQKFNQKKCLQLWDWAYFVDFSSAIQELKELALEENWYYKQQDPNHPDPILCKYIKYTFCRLQREDKIMYSGDYAAFNTGLVNALYDPIYALFDKNKNKDKQPYHFLNFCVAGVDKAGKNLTEHFNPLPEKATYLESSDDYIFDASTQPHVDWDHIILERTERLPLDFLEEYCPKHFQWENPREMRLEQRKEYFVQLAKAIKEDQSTYRKISMQMKNSLDTAIKRANWNYKTAIPQYYPTHDSTSLLLPLALKDEKIIDLALVVEKQSSGNYLGHTVLPLAWAYSNARLITRPDSDWLSTDRIDQEDDEME